MENIFYTKLQNKDVKQILKLVFVIRSYGLKHIYLWCRRIGSKLVWRFISTRLKKRLQWKYKLGYICGKMDFYKLFNIEYISAEKNSNLRMQLQIGWMIVYSIRFMSMCMREITINIEKAKIEVAVLFNYAGMICGGIWT